MKTFLFDINNEEEAFVEANTKGDAMDKLVFTYGFDEQDIAIYEEVSEEYAEMMGYDTYWERE